MATHSSILSWRITWTEESGGLQSMGSQRVGHDLSDLAHTHPQVSRDMAHSQEINWRGIWQPTEPG